MSTITGTIVDATGAPQHARIDFISKSTPLAGSGIVTTNTDKTVRTDPTAGTFSVVLAGGNYQVVITTHDAQTESTTFNIVVPSDNNSYPIDQVTATPLAFVFTPPNTVWNGARAGHITFAPLASPPAPTTAATTGGSQTGADQSSYCVAWLNAAGDITLAGPAVANIPPTAETLRRAFSCRRPLPARPLPTFIARPMPGRPGNSDGGNQREPAQHSRWLFQHGL